MQLQTLLAAATLALSASAAGMNNTTDIGPTVQERLAGLELGYIYTNNQLDQLRAGSMNVTADDVLSTYLGTVKTEDKDLDKNQPSKPLDEGKQLTICQAFHSLTLTGTRLNTAFVDNMDQFNTTQRMSLMKGINKVYNETTNFYTGVAAKALTYCVGTVVKDEEALGISFDMVRDAYGFPN